MPPRATVTETSLRERLLAVAAELLGNGGAAGEGIALARPPRPDLGDYSTNAALLLAPVARSAPRELAERLGEGLAQRLGAELDRFEVAGPGFLNLFLSDGWHRSALAQVLSAGDRHGGGGAETPERIIVEFVSANPTGPMHVGHARNAAYGDALARVLSLHGHRVGREFYVNDAGSQVRKLGESIVALARGEDPPADGYRGEYVRELLAQLPAVVSESGDPLELGRAAVGLMIVQIEETLERFNVAEFDHWQLESELHAPRERLRANMRAADGGALSPEDGGTLSPEDGGTLSPEDGGTLSSVGGGTLSSVGGSTLSPVERSLELLEQQGSTYRKDGALWLRSSEHGDDKDRVLIRSNGEHTYFASDIAYHQDKRERGFDRQIDVWGADHHGYVARMKAAYEALGGDPQELELLIMQLVHLVRRGERAQMSKRAGEFVTLEELIDEIGVDAARWFLLSRSHDTTIDLDLDLAREQSAENPVYYVQYAHARISSVLAKASAERVGYALEEVERIGRALEEVGEAHPSGETLHPSERELVKKLLAFPGEIREATDRRAPHRIAAYALELAQGFTAFYRDCRVVGVEPESVESLRIALCVAAQRTIARSLDLLGVSAPTQM